MIILLILLVVCRDRHGVDDQREPHMIIILTSIGG